MKEIDSQKVKELYEKADSVWQDDNWYSYSRKMINKFIFESNLSKEDFILNAGSGGSTYNLSNKMQHLDIAANKIESYENYTVGTIEDTPYLSNYFDCTICVGSVINYVDAVKSISEIHRTLKQGGKLILEYDSSYGYEYLGTKAYKKDAELINLKYYDEYNEQWVYSPRYIDNLLRSYGFKILRKKGFHILGSLHFRFFQNENKAARFDKFDHLLEKIPYFRNRADNIIILAEKL